MKKIVLMAALFVLSGCHPAWHDESEMYHYLPRTAGEVPAVLQYYYQATPYEHEFFGGLDHRTEYTNEMRVCTVNGKFLGSYLSCGAQNSEEVAKTNRVLLSPGETTLSFNAKTKNFGMHFSTTINARSGEIYYFRVIPFEQLSPSEHAPIRAAGNYPSPLIQIYTGSRQLLQSVYFTPQSAPTTNCTTLANNSNVYGPAAGTSVCSASTMVELVPHFVNPNPVAYPASNAPFAPALPQ